MRLIHTARFEKDYSDAPSDVQRAFDKQERLLADNLCQRSFKFPPPAVIENSPTPWLIRR